MDGGAVIARRDLDRSVQAARGGAADEERQLQPLALHFLRYGAHFIEARRDQAGEANNVDFLTPCRVDDLGDRSHDAEIDHLVVVTLQHHADDVLADVVHVALDRRHKDFSGLGLLAVGVLVFHIGDENGDRLFHHPRALDHLGQEHLAGAEQVADGVHAVHQRPFDNVERAHRLKPRLFHIFVDEIADAVHQRMAEPRINILLAPTEVGRLLLAACAAVAVGDFQQPLGGILAAVKQHILDAVQQVIGNILIDGQLAGIDDAHIHAGADRVIEKSRMHGFPHPVVAAERERHVGKTARDMHAGQIFADAPRRRDKGAAVIVMFLDAGGDGEYIRIEDDILGRDADLLGQQPIGAGANLKLAVFGVGLAVFVERHHHHRRAVAPHFLGMAQEFLFAFLEADRIDNRLALHAFESRLDHRPF